MKKVFVGKEAIILNGKCAGISGLVVGADSEECTVEIFIEDGTYITTHYSNIYQVSSMQEYKDDITSSPENAKAFLKRIGAYDI